MPGGAYSALSGMRMRLDDLDRLAADLANAGTAGYKSERTSTEEARRAFTSALDSAIDVTRGGLKTNFHAGAIASTGRDLDMAIDGPGFFEIETPGGTRYTRAGNFKVQPDGVLTTMDGMPVAGEDGEISLPVGPVMVGADGTIRVGQAIAGKLKVVTFENEDLLVRESGTKFLAPDGVEGTEVENARVIGGSLEQANVSIVERVAVMTEVSRAFEALQKGISVLMNEIDGRAITELGRK
jgi:flagellar basal-body rod protein FlgF